jgi:hypothetical protein
MLVLIKNTVIQKYINSLNQKKKFFKLKKVH